MLTAAAPTAEARSRERERGSKGEREERERERRSGHRSNVVAEFAVSKFDKLRNK